MPTQVQVRGTTQATQEARTLASREIDINTTDGRICVHDGATAGGVRHVNYKDQQNQEFVYAAASGTNAITMSCAVAPSAYQAGQRFVFKAANTITGSATLNVNSLGAKTIKKVESGALTNLEASDIISGVVYACVYDGTYMQLQQLSGGGSGGGIVYSATASTDSTLGDTGIFSSGNVYEIEIANFTPAVDGEDLCLQLHDGTSWFDNIGDYDVSGVEETTISGTLTYDIQKDATVYSSYMPCVALNVGSAANESCSGTIKIFDPAAGSEYVKITWDFAITDTSGAIRRYFGAAQLDSDTSAMTGFRVRFMSSPTVTGGTIESGRIVVREKSMS